MPLRARLALAFALMTLPVLLVGALVYRSNLLERRALGALERGLGRSRTYAEVESAMQAQGEIVWRALSGFEPDAARELELNRQVVTYWLDRWQGELRPDERRYADAVRRLRAQVDSVTDSVLVLAASGRREAGYALAQRELKARLTPALTDLNHEIYRQTRTSTVQRALDRVEDIVDDERGLLLLVLALAALAAAAMAWGISRRLVRPIQELRGAMAVVGAGDLDHPVHTGAPDEIGDLARSFDAMTARLKESRAAVERAQAQLVESEKLASVGQMAAAVAHGLRNPLASLRASAQFALRHPDSPAARETLAAIVDEVDRLDHRITHLLTYSRPSPAHRMRERAGALVEGALAALRPLFAERGVAVETALPAALPEVLVDPAKLEQALVEVISNALDAMPQGGTLRVLGAVEADGGVAITIADTGRGIAPEALPNVFEPFFTTRAEGTGLGLAIAKRFIEQHGGRIELASEPGRGTTVRILLPAAPAGAPAEVA
jgi:signal transduction histidine kinase